MQLIKFNPKLSLKTNIIRGFIPLTVILLVITAIGLIVSVILINDNIITESQTTLIDQVTRHSKIISEKESELLRTKLNAFSQSVIKPIKYSTVDTFRSNYSLGYSPSYFDLNLHQPLSIDSRQIRDVSFGHSSYYFPNTNEQTFANATQERKGKERILSG